MGKVGLDEVMTEIQTLEEILTGANEQGYDPPRHLIHMLVRTAVRKIDYLHEKYDFQFDSSDLHFIEDIPNLLDFSKADGGKAERSTEENEPA